MENNNNKYFIRVFYQKRFKLIYLSHLELIRTVERLLRRSYLPFVLTKGFSPHIKLSFSAALPVGIESLYEAFDVEISKIVNLSELKECLNNNSLEDLKIIDCKYVNPKVDRISSYINAIHYCAVIDGYVKPNLAVFDKLVVVKHGNTKYIDIRPYLKGPVKIENNKDNVSKIKFTFNIINGASIRADLFVEQLLSFNKYSKFSQINIIKYN